jgi:3-oxoacyl-[acyl-carrier-protein] synthase III
MPKFSFSNIEIAGIASAVPENEVSVTSLANIFGKQLVSRIQSLTGVNTFRKADENQTAADLGFAAAK